MLEKINGEWWIKREEAGEDMLVGPYGTKDEAESDRIGMERFDQLHDRSGFVTCDKPQPRSRDDESTKDS